MGDVRGDWIGEQLTELDDLKRDAPKDADVIRLSSGLHVLLQEGQTAKVLVPAARRRALTLQAHINIKHRGWRKTLDQLRKSYYWKNMSTTIKRWTQECTECPIYQCRRNLKNNQFSSVIYEGPRTAYAFDFYGIAKSADGHQWVLTVIDLFSREVQFLPLKTRRAEETLRNLLKNVVHTNGVPSIFMSDEAPEFLSKLLAGLCSALGIRHITTKGYNPAANAICETVHTFLGKCLRMLPAVSRPVWPEHLVEFAFAHNTTKHEALGFTPFEIAHGVPARTVVDVMGMLEAKEAVPTKEHVTGYFGQIKQRAQAYKEMAKHNQSLAAEDTLGRLNAGKPRTFARGDLVSIYFPSRSTGEDWKTKHQARPNAVTKKLSTSAYELCEVGTQRVFRRSVANINRYKAPLSGDAKAVQKMQAEKQDPITCDEEQIGDVVAVKSIYGLCRVFRNFMCRPECI